MNYKKNKLYGITEIPSHYHKVTSGECWCNIYDDSGLQATIEADTIDFYRAGEMGLLIVAKGNNPRACQF